MFLLDTNVVSELRKASSGKIDTHVASWAARTTKADLFISVITILELEQGVLSIERRDTSQAEVLRAWLHARVLPEFVDRVLTIDMAVARQCARLHVPNPRAERDAFIAATALVHDMTVVTRNLRDFEPMGVSTFNPWLG